MHWSAFNAVDAIVAVFLLAGLVGGVRRGLSGELARAVIAVGCIVAAMLYTQPLADWGARRFGLDADRAYLGALVALLLGSFSALTTIRLLLGNLMDFHFKGRLERVGGGLCGLLRASVVMAIVLQLLSLIPNPNLHRLLSQESWAGRRAIPLLRPMYESLSTRVPALRAAERPVEPPLEEAPAELLPVTGPADDLEPYPLPDELDPPAPATDAGAVPPDADLGPLP